MAQKDLSDKQLIRNANLNAQTAVETANTTDQRIKELAPEVGVHELRIAALEEVVTGVMHALYQADLTIIALHEHLGLELNERQQHIKHMQSVLIQAEQQNVPAEHAPETGAVIAFPARDGSATSHV